MTVRQAAVAALAHGELERHGLMRRLKSKSRPPNSYAIVRSGLRVAASNAPGTRDFGLNMAGSSAMGKVDVLARSIGWAG